MSHTRILLGLLVGAATGVAVNAFFGGGDPRVEWFVVQFTEPIGELFLRLLLMTVVPLVFSSLVVGVAGVGDSALTDDVRLAVPGFRKDYRLGDVDCAICSRMSAVHDDGAFRF